MSDPVEVQRAEARLLLEQLGQTAEAVAGSLKRAGVRGRADWEPASGPVSLYLRARGLEYAVGCRTALHGSDPAGDFLVPEPVRDLLQALGRGEFRWLRESGVAR